MLLPVLLSLLWVDACVYFVHGYVMYVCLVRFISLHVSLTLFLLFVIVFVMLGVVSQSVNIGHAILSRNKYLCSSLRMKRNQRAVENGAELNWVLLWIHKYSLVQW